MTESELTTGYFRFTDLKLSEPIVIKRSKDVELLAIEPLINGTRLKLRIGSTPATYLIKETPSVVLDIMAGKHNPTANQPVAPPAERIADPNAGIADPNEEEFK